MILLLGVTLTIIGVQFFFILKELKKSIEKINLILDDATLISQNFSQTTKQINSLVNSLRETTHQFSARAGTPLATGLAILGLTKTLLDKFKGAKENQAEKSAKEIEED